MDGDRRKRQTHKKKRKSSVVVVVVVVVDVLDESTSTSSPLWFVYLLEFNPVQSLNRTCVLSGSFTFKIIAI